MRIYDEEFEPFSDTEAQTILADFPIEDILQTIESQVSDPTSTSTDYVDSIIMRYHSLREEFSDDTDMYNDLISNTMSALSQVIEIIDDEYDLSFNLDMIDNIDDMIRYAEALYGYFILRYQKNITTFIKNYISENRKAVVEMIGDGGKSKDVTTSTTKKKMKNKDDAVIVSNIDTIMSWILDQHIEPSEFVRLSGGNYKSQVVHSAIMEGNMIGDFIGSYTEQVTDNVSGIYDEIASTVKSKLQKTK